jgi:hypothetical protein
MKKLLFIISIIMISSCTTSKISYINQTLDEHTNTFHTDIVESILSFYENDTLLNNIYIPKEFLYVKDSLELVQNNL